MKKDYRKYLNRWISVIQDEIRWWYTVAFNESYILNDGQSYKDYLYKRFVINTEFKLESDID